MIDALQIPLAADDGNGTEFLVVLAVVVVSIIAGLLQKANKAKQEAKEQEQARQRRRQRTAARQGQAQPVQPAGMSQPPQTLRPQAAREVQTPPPVHPPRRRLAVKAKSSTGFKPKKTSVEDRHVGSAHVGRLAHAEGVSSGAGGGGTRVNLSAREAARQAMIYHEIFSPPKALRQDKAIWEM